jgi:hypothetical protein
MLYCLILMTKFTFLTAMPIPLCKVIFGENNKLWTLSIGWINALYMDPNRDFSFSCEFQWNTSGPSLKWAVAKRWSKAFQSTRRYPDRSLLNVTLGGELSITFTIVLPLWWTMLYNVGYCSRRVVVPNHLSSYNLISVPSLIENFPRRKNWFFIAISPAQKCESPCFQKIYDKAFETMYFYFRIGC